MSRSTRSDELRSGELARRAGVSADTLRVYESRGLLEPPRRTPNGYRIYPKESLERVLLIQRALAFGFTLPELSRFLADRESGRAPCHDVREAASRRLCEIESAIADLRDLKKSLAGLVAAWDAALSGRPKAGRHHFLEALPSRDRRGAAALAARRFSKRHARTKETP